MKRSRMKPFRSGSWFAAQEALLQFRQDVLIVFGALRSDADSGSSGASSRAGRRRFVAGIRSSALLRGKLAALLVMAAILLVPIEAAGLVVPAAGCPTPSPVAVTANVQQITSGIDVLFDAERRFSLTDVMQPGLCDRFQPVQGTPTFGFEGRGVWLRLGLPALDSTQPWRLLVPYMGMERVCAHWPLRSGAYQSECGRIDDPMGKGVRTPQGWYFRIPADRDPERPVFLYAQGDNELYLPLEIGTADAFVEHQRAKQTLLGALYGLMIGAVLFGIVTFAMVGDRMHLYFAAFIIAVGLYLALRENYLSSLGIAGRTVGPLVPPMVGFIMAFAGLFLSRFLNTREHTPVLHRLLLVFSCLFIATVWIQPLPPPVLHRWVGAPLGLAWLFTILAASVRRMAQGSRAAMFALLAWLCVGTSWVLNTFEVMRLPLANHQMTMWFLYAGLLLMPGFLVIGLVDRLKTLARERDGAIARRERAEAERAANSRFLAVMSHEIRTPMNGVLGLLELHERSKLDTEQRESVSLIRQSARTLLTVIDDILDVSKIEAGRIELEQVPVSLQQLAEGVMETLAPGARAKNVRLIAFVDPSLPENVIGDPSRLRQVLFNLVGNALKFTEKGHVLLTVTPDREEDTTQSDETGVPLRFTIEDTGIGIPESVRTRLFQPYAQAELSTARRYGGTGLGLAISQGLVRRMGGQIDFSSAEGQGSKFWFGVRLPGVAAVAPGPTPPLDGIHVHLMLDDAAEVTVLCSYLKAAGALIADSANAARVVIEDGADGIRVRGKGQSPMTIARPVLRSSLTRAVMAMTGRLLQPELPEASQRQTGTGSPSATRRILVAEDNAINQALIRVKLSVLGYQVTIVGDGGQALRLLESAPFDLLITDLNMPGMDGWELAAATRRLEAEGKRAGRLPILAFSADAGDQSMERGATVGIDCFLDKLCNVDELRAALERLLPQVQDRAASTVTLPLSDSTEVLSRTAATSPSQEQSQCHGRRILVAEDDATNQKLLSQQLMQLGYEATIAGDGLRALLALDSATFDLLITDLHMPGMSGLELAAIVRSKEKGGERIGRLPILAITADVTRGDDRRCSDAGMDGCLSKPCSLDQLGLALERLLPIDNHSHESSQSPGFPG